jgi:hypothetical protein
MAEIFPNCRACIQKYDREMDLNMTAAHANDGIDGHFMKVNGWSRPPFNFTISGCTFEK